MFRISLKHTSLLVLNFLFLLVAHVFAATGPTGSVTDSSTYRIGSGSTAIPPSANPVIIPPYGNSSVTLPSTTVSRGSLSTRVVSAAAISGPGTAPLGTGPSSIGPTGIAPSNGSVAAPNFHFNPAIWSGSTPVVSCNAPCNIILPPYPLSIDTTITFAPLTTTLTQAWPKGTSTMTALDGTTLTFPPITTSQVCCSLKLKRFTIANVVRYRCSTSTSRTRMSWAPLSSSRQVSFLYFQSRLAHLQE